MSIGEPGTAAGTTETVVNVTGMTCDHCIRAVTDELVALHGVTAVTIELVLGGVSRATVISTAPLADSDIEAAIDEAGYDVAGIDRP